MSGHEEWRGQAALSAAGMLDAAEERRLREHLRDCPECARLSGELAKMAEGLECLPPPPVPVNLAIRTDGLLRAELARAADRRQGAVLAGSAAVLAWILMLAAWYGYRMLAGGGTLAWLAWWLVPVWTAVAAAGALHSRKRLEGRIS